MGSYRWILELPSSLSSLRGTTQLGFSGRDELVVGSSTRGGGSPDDGIFFPSNSSPQLNRSALAERGHSTEDGDHAEA